MARTVSDTVDIILRRVRQSGDIAVGNDFATQLMSKAQRVINTTTKRVKATTAFTTTASTLIYSYRTTLTAAVDIISVSESNRELLKFDTLGELVTFDNDWLTASGTRFEAWAQLGRDLLIIYPGKAGASSVSVTYTTLTTEYTSYSGDGATNLDLPDEDVDFVILLTEIMLLIRNRVFKDIENKLKRLSGQLAPFRIL